MPTIRVELFEGRSAEQKRQLAQALTDAAVRTLGGSPDSVDVIFYDIARQDWATGGTLWSERAAQAGGQAGAQAGGASGQASGTAAAGGAAGQSGDDR